MHKMVSVLNFKAFAVKRIRKVRKMEQRFEEFVSMINIAYKCVQKVKSYEMKSLGLKGSHVMVMYFLGTNEKGLTSGELCTKCREDKAAVSRNLQYLVKAGYIKVSEESAGKKYKVKNVLTEKGRDVYNRLSEIIAKDVEKFGEGLSSEERYAFYKTLGVIVANFDKYGADL